MEYLNSVETEVKNIYVTFKTDIYVEPFVYNFLSRYKRSLLAQLRCGILPLLETGRFVNVRDDETGRLRKLTVNERLVKYVTLMM